MSPRHASIFGHAGRTSSQASNPQSDYSNEPAETLSLLKRPQLEMRTSRGGFGVVGLLSTLCVFLVTGGTATLILGWLYAFRDSEFVEGGTASVLRNGTFAIRESSGSDEETHSETLRILMFSALASHLVSVTSTVLVTLLAYRTAAQWLRASEDPDDINLTPIQHGLLIRTLGSGSLMSIINSLRYASRSRRANAPRFFTEALVGVTGIYILSHTVGLVDLWLHSGARSISVIRAVPMEAEALYGIMYDEEKCGSFNKTVLPCQKLIAPLNGGIWWAPRAPWIYYESYDTALDVNPYKRVEYINNTAILVPGPGKDFKSQGFTFNTHGLRVECANLRDQCDRMPVPVLDVIGRGVSPVTNCSKGGYPRVPYHTSGSLKISGRDTRNIQNFVLGIIGDEMGGMIHGTPDFSSAWTSNPASAVVQMRWQNQSALWNTDTIGVMYLSALDLYATCNMTFLDVLARYDSIEAEWSILETSLSQPELASVFWTPTIFQMATDDLAHALMPYVLNRGAVALDVLESSMAKYSMAYAAPLTKFAAASNITTTELLTLGLYPITPTLLLVGCLYIYSIVALVIFFLSCISNNRMISVPRHLTRGGEKDEERSALDVAQTWLTDPLPLMGSLFPGGDGRHAARSVESDPLRQVYDSDWELGKVGIGLYRGNNGEMIFGLVRQNPSRSRRYGRFFPLLDVESALQEKAPIHGSKVIVPSLAVIRKTGP
ncbi:hypothetical protein M407DRAFT_17499 [Tulasnella calospora MUT 4182]|uniref:Uncharacterized protein n=1 Tax=Tulasnella calospora MUT 4182 TaxID=1051891 RepID=A0A0C3QLD6_9AGAM|nr:hypothetical protein M407DRAFT_17499 [Tulasnella calospora MUT 4182]